MSTDSTTPVETVDVEAADDLAAFKAEFYKASQPEDDPVEDKVDIVENADAEEVEDAGDEEVVEAGDEGEDESEPEEKPHRNRKTAKERISELTAKVRETEAREAAKEAAALARVAALEARLARLEAPEPKAEAEP